MTTLITAKPNVVVVSEIQNPKSENRN